MPNMQENKMMTPPMTPVDKEMIKPWSLGTPAMPGPYESEAYTGSRGKNVVDNMLELVGQTPMVRLNKIPQKYGVKCKMYAKLEFYNPGGSIKDRIAVRMFKEAEAKGVIRPGFTIIEPTSGNTGIGLALCCAIYGYRCIIVLPQKMSAEKVNTLKALGAEIVRTPTEAMFDSPDSHISVAKKLNAEIKDSFILNQYDNPYNVLAHYDQTAEEIDDQLEGDFDMVVCGAGTGGTITGIGKKLKEKFAQRGNNKKLTIVGVDPVGSILADNGSVENPTLSAPSGPYMVEGIGYDFIPTIIDYSVIDTWYKSCDKESLPLAREIIREEGILTGGSSGAALSAALKACKDLDETQTCVVIFPDGVRNYMSKFLSDDWMHDNNL